MVNMESEGSRPRKLQKTEHPAASPTGATTEAKNAAAGEEVESSNKTEEQSNEPGEDRIEEGEPSAPALSKNQRKKLLKKERWEAGRDDRKAHRKVKARARKERQRAARAETLSKDDPATAEESKGKKLNRRDAKRAGYRQSVTLPITFVLDCGFDGLMIDKERTSLSSQITRCYSDNSKAPYRSHLVVSSFDGFLKERFDTVLEKVYEKWKGVKFFMDEDYVAAAQSAQTFMKGPHGGEMAGMFADYSKDEATKETGEIIYLTSDSPDILTELKPYNTYIVGAIVDKNRHKNLCYKRAMDRGIKTAKLPISDYMDMASRFVLTTNQVVEIMVRWLQLGDWGQAFDAVIPKRKGGVMKTKVDSNSTVIDEEEPERVEANSNEEGDEDVEEQEIAKCGNDEEGDGKAA